MNPAMLGTPYDLVVFRYQRCVQYDGDSATLHEVKDQKGSSSPTPQAGNDDVGVEDDRDWPITGAGLHGLCRSIRPRSGVDHRLGAVDQEGFVAFEEVADHLGARFGPLGVDQMSAIVNQHEMAV